MRYALRVDANQTEVIRALEAAGALVDVIGKPVDLLVGCITDQGQPVLAMFEVKDGQKVKSAQKRTPAQVRFFERWAGFPVCLVDGPESALMCLNVMKRGKV